MATNSCTSPLTAAAFFKDAPWLGIPANRRAEILIEPLYPRVGLLGGASTDGGGKVSKLAALAAARKKKENEKSNDASSKPSTSSVALLDRLGGGRRVNNKAQDGLVQSKDHGDALATIMDESMPSARNRTYPMRKRRSPSPSPSSKEEAQEPPEDDHSPPQLPKPVAATPSSFARTMLGASAETGDPYAEISQLTMFKLPYEAEMNITESSAFAGPSPDDIVTNAQNWKGLALNVQETCQSTNVDQVPSQIKVQLKPLRAIKL